MDKVVVIAGGTTGIGRELVDIYLTHGYSVATFSSRKEKTDALKKSVRQQEKIYIETFDIQNKKSSSDFVRNVINQFGRIDIYIFNSGICQDKTFSKMTVEQWEKVISVNFTNTFTLTQEIFKQMKTQAGHKKIFFMTSLSGLEGAFGQANYAASKAALIGLSKSLAQESKKFAIEVNAISPAALTDMTIPIVSKIAEQCKREEKPFPDYWKIGSAKEAAQSIYRLSNNKTIGTGEIFAINGSKIEVYRPLVKVPFQLGDNDDY
ncbi:SDR family NAD(P)-dependent oxidoreductase [Candidatus Enterococcus courvalinii]|uniref:SDR family NAD(P)-dependent oxidoreductase n=1 Tax=Candidatus Enterococcus courvalinii TaxID=2815329 RepID=A0ABS3HYG6_9ENTE|nr:SDR family NAD(P)-dependent oxidoreductase [Enterococcus sp. MSG2901]MBO0481110.1 SDR family NAD(P)-dependent oxidoreductase [Enterococcus sp. MSG2901]